MRRVITYFFGIVFLTFGNCAALFAEDYYKIHHIAEDFSENAIPTKPSNWIVRATNSKTNLSTPPYGGAAGVTWADEMLTISGSGGGNRGAEIVFPTPQANPNMAGYEVIWMELDWTINTAVVGAKNAYGLIFMDSLNTATDPRPIFGIYLAGNDGFFHYWNLDIQGPETAEEGVFYGAVFGADFEEGSRLGFRRQGTNVDETNTINASTRTTVAYTAGHTYHLTVGLNFTTKQVVSLTIADKDGSTITITDQPFIDPAAETLGTLATVNTKAGNIGNGDNVNITAYFDNLEIYVNEIILGTADVTVNYKDREGATVKASRVAVDEPYEAIYKLLASDKERVIEGGFYYSYDAGATHTANAEKGDDGESVTVVAGGVSLDVIFKKSEIAAGTYVWTGADGWNWNELENNFSVNGGANISFQTGNGVAFSNAEVTNKDVVLDEIADLGDNNMLISAEGYALSGTGRITGTGTLTVDAAAALGVNNQLDGGAVVNTTGVIHVKHASAAKKFKVVDNANLKLEAGNTFSAPIEGAGGILNIDAVSDNFYTPAITNASTVNIQLDARGRLRGSDWTNKWTATFPENAQINVTNQVEDGKSAGLGVNNTTLEKVKVHLGDSTRVLRHYNENAASTDTLFFGELSGTAASIIEGGFIDGRTTTYAFGGLNTDAVFEGIIRPFLRGDTALITTSTLHLVKKGTGKWTLKGDAQFNGDFTVQSGTLELIDNTVGTDASQIIVNAGATLKGDGAIIGSIITTVGADAVLAGAFHFDQALLLDEGSLYKPFVNSFDEGDYDRITADGGITAMGILDITVNSATEGQRIKLLTSEDPNFESGFASILVNGVDITDNEATTPGAEFVWLPETSELLSLINKVGILDVQTGKAIKSIRYYDISGRPVSKDAKGFVIQQIRYEDNTIATRKSYKLNR